MKFLFAVNASTHISGPYQYASPTALARHSLQNSAPFTSRRAMAWLEDSADAGGNYRALSITVRSMPLIRVEYPGP